MRTAVNKHHSLLNNRNLSSHRCVVWKFEVKVRAELVSHEASLLDL